MKKTVNVRMDEHDKIMYTKTFEIVDRDYSIGGRYDGEIILEIESIMPDVENDSDTNDYRYFRLICTWNGEDGRANDEYSEYFIAVPKAE